MHLDTARLNYLLNRYFNGKATQQEKAELHTCLNDAESGQYVYELMKTVWEKYIGEGSVVDKHRSDEILESILAMEAAPVRKSGVYKMPGWKFVVAASVLLLLGVAYLILALNGGEKKVHVPVAEVKLNDTINAPESNKAVITLEDGRKIYLDETSQGERVKLGEVNLTKVGEDEVVYNDGASRDTRVEFNTLTVPRGSRVVRLHLADGTRIWLNAASSLRYPTAFPGKERVVEITGEAYFEVAHNAEKKFYVSGRGIKTEVLGTHFNVNMYDDESEIRVTLLEGSVNVFGNGASQLLKPKQQLRIGSEGAMNLLKNVDVDDVVSWKNGHFSLKGIDITELMRQVSRWYNVDIICRESPVKRKFGGSVSRDVSLNTLIDALKEYGVLCKLDDRTLTVINP